MAKHIKNAQKYQPVEESDIDEDQAIPLNVNASEVSFDNFEKENASEKKRKNIYDSNRDSKINKSKKDGSQGELDDTEETGIEDSE